MNREAQLRARIAYVDHPMVCECGHGPLYHPHSDSGRHCTHKWCVCPSLKPRRAAA